jgi:hypothetical protein
VATATQTSPVIPHDRAEQLQQIQQGLLPGETIYAVYDCTGAGTGFVGVTDLRVILQDKSFVGKLTAITSIPYGKVQSVSIVTNKSMMGSFFSSGQLAISTAQAVHMAEFRGTDKARHIHDVIMHHLIIR